jgi:hypothetical protein
MFFRVFNNTRRSYDRAKWHENPRVFYKAAGVFVAIAILALVFSDEPAYCKQNGVRVCSSFTPSANFSTIAIIFVCLGLAGFAIWHARELHRYDDVEDSQESTEFYGRWGRNDR